MWTVFEHIRHFVQQLSTISADSQTRAPRTAELPAGITYSRFAASHTSAVCDTQQAVPARKPIAARPRHLEPYAL